METNKTNMIPEEKLEGVSGGASNSKLHIVLAGDEGCLRYRCQGCSGSSLGKHNSLCRMEEEYRDTCYSCRYFRRIGEVEGETEGYCSAT